MFEIGFGAADETPRSHAGDVSIGVVEVPSSPIQLDDDLDLAHWEAILAAGPLGDDALDGPWDAAFSETDVFAPTDSERLAAVVARVGAGWVDPGLATALPQIDVAALTADEAVTYAQVWQRVVASAMAGRDAALAAVNDRLTGYFHAEEARVGEVERLENTARAVAGLPLIDRPGKGFVPPELTARNELGAALRLAPRSIDAAVAHAIDLVGPWAPLLDALRVGDVTDGHVRAIGKWLAFLPAAGRAATREAYAAQCAQILDVVIPYARTHTPGEAGRKAKVLVLTADPTGSRQRRREQAEAGHGVSVTPTEPGTCQLVATMPLAHGEAIMSAVNTLAKHADFQTADGCVTKGQRQIAALTTLILGEPGSVGRVDGPVAEAKIKAQVSVVVPLATITAAHGVDSLPGGRIGVEPVPADVVRDLIADADCAVRRLVTDEIGTVIDIGRAHYTPTGLQQRLIRLRDGTCRFPGCTTRAEHADIDHARPWDDGGPTDLANLGALCRYHHQAKTHGGWRITHSTRSGACTWQSPLGRIYEHTPDQLSPPEPVTFDGSTSSCAPVSSEDAVCPATGGASRKPDPNIPPF